MTLDVGSPVDSEISLRLEIKSSNSSVGSGLFDIDSLSILIDSSLTCLICSS